MSIRIAPLPAGFLQRVRHEGIDDLGQPVKRVVAEGGEPCRDVLRRAVAGEELILASFSPFSKAGPYKEYGPVFVLARDGAPVSAPSLPTDGYLRERFVIRAYSEEESILDAVLVTPEEASATIEKFLDRGEAAFARAVPDATGASRAEWIGRHSSCHPEPRRRRRTPCVRESRAIDGVLRRASPAQDDSKPSPIAPPAR
jgi:hypothetical protein